MRWPRGSDPTPCCRIMAACRATLRHDAETRLKNGELRAVVATASLELGIDIGTVDLAIQIGSPRSIAVALQRIGRSGHWVGAKPRGILFPTTRDELIECAAIIHAIRAGDLERIEIPQNALDIVAQQIVAEASCQDWGEAELYDLVRTAYPYRNLSLRDFEAVVTMMSEGIATSRGRSGALLHRDQVNHRLRGRRGARLAAITSGGAIPDSAAYAVIVEPEGKTVGTIDEDFAVESLTGDVFLLGTHSWRIRHVGQGKVRVEDAHGAQAVAALLAGRSAGAVDRIIRGRFAACRSRTTRLQPRVPTWMRPASRQATHTCGRALHRWELCPLPTP